jgi:hypothetical protein
MEIINVLELQNGVPASITSFSDKDKDGNEKAEEFFINTIEIYSGREQLDEEDKKFYLNNGYYGDDNGYEIYILHSDNNE